MRHKRKDDGMNSQEFFVRDEKAIAVTSMVRIGAIVYCGLTGASRTGH
jgi:hypothetical protein